MMEKNLFRYPLMLWKGKKKIPNLSCHQPRGIMRAQIELRKVVILSSPACVRIVIFVKGSWYVKCFVGRWGTKDQELEEVESLRPLNR